MGGFLLGLSTFDFRLVMRKKELCMVFPWQAGNVTLNNYFFSLGLGAYPEGSQWHAAVYGKRPGSCAAERE